MSDGHCNTRRVSSSGSLNTSQMLVNPPLTEACTVSGQSLAYDVFLMDLVVLVCRNRLDEHAHNGLHNFQSRCSSHSSHCSTTVVCCPGALTVRVNVLSLHLKSDLYLDGTDTAPVPIHFRFLFERRLHHTVQASLEESFIVHSRLRLVCSRALGHSLCGLPPLKPPLIVLGTVVQVFSSLRGLCSMLPWHTMVAEPCHVPLPSSSASSDSVLVVCDTCGEWTSGAGGPLVSARIASLFPAAQV